MKTEGYKKARSLSDAEFDKLIEFGPLVSIDLVIENDNQILLGLRKNKPAQHFWFVPGGRIHKGESKEVAFKRITNDEIKKAININDASLIGVFHHLYENDNKNNIPDLDTHYIVLAYYINTQIDIDSLPKIQHSEYAWFKKENLLSENRVHSNVVPYFDTTMHGKININKLNLTQYNVLNSRRDSFNSLVWQTPVTSLTALAFLFVIALNGAIVETYRLIASLLAFFAAAASIQLLIKHRFMEEFHASTLEKYELVNGYANINGKISVPEKGLYAYIKKRRSYRVWLTLLIIFALAAIFNVFIVLCPVILIDLKDVWIKFTSIFFQ
jgi:colanic acid biosynthesis protein WcaH